MRDDEVRRLIRAERRRHYGVIAGLLGCAFAILGIFTIGTIFVPLALLCSIIGFARAAGVLSLSGVAVSLLGCVLSVIGVMSSPALLLIAAGFLGNAQRETVATSSETVDRSSQSLTPLAEPQLTPPLLSTAAAALPSSGPQAWCQRRDTIEYILKALSSLDGVRDANVVVTEFSDATTSGVDVKQKSFSCHGVAHVMGGQVFPGTFSVVSDLSGKPTWQWVNDDGTVGMKLLISCGSGGCFASDDSPAAQAAADRANEENRKAAVEAASRFRSQTNGSNKK
jgi:hypothetical protein